ncbi:MAG: hypothetical protein AABX82_01790 [Nanoarchaeota archaeon]
MHGVQYKKETALVIKDNPKTWCFDGEPCTYIVDMDTWLATLSAKCMVSSFEVKDCGK